MTRTFLYFFIPILTCCEAFIPKHSFHSPTRKQLQPKSKSSIHTSSKSESQSSSSLSGWLDNFLPAPIESSNDDSKRRTDFPEQYPASYELSDITLESDARSTASKEIKIIRPLLKHTMLESRALQIVYDAELHGWDPRSFHERVDGKGAAVVIATYLEQGDTSGAGSGSGSCKVRVVGGYNPKGWSSNGGARPSVAAFLFYQKKNIDNDSSSVSGTFQKLQKCGGGGLACANDDPNYGISFGPDALVVPFTKLQTQEHELRRQRFASSKLGPYFERGPENLSSLFENEGGGVQLESLKVLTGVYNAGEDIPYSGAVMDMTSG